jgi:hypothetical protein
MTGLTKSVQHKVLHLPSLNTGGIRGIVSKFHHGQDDVIWPKMLRVTILSYR